VSDFRAPRNATKADVRVEQRGGREVVVKDYGPRSWWVRLFYGRPTLRREARTYARLAGVRGIPACFGFAGKDALLLERAPGEPLSKLAPGRVDARVFDELDRILRDVHARGVAIADLHRSNVLVAPGPAVSVIDFAVARHARDPARPGPLLRLLQQLDAHAAARLRARYLGLPEPVPEGLFGRLYRTLRALKP
jgi:tRNA A-37 threonylcarbamoyl transferase component Bud32